MSSDVLEPEEILWYATGVGSGIFILLNICNLTKKYCCICSARRYQRQRQWICHRSWPVITSFIAISIALGIFFGNWSSASAYCSADHGMVGSFGDD
jgi:hypothetical protein